MCGDDNGDDDVDMLICDKNDDNCLAFSNIIVSAGAATVVLLKESAQHL